VEHAVEYAEVVLWFSAVAADVLDDLETPHHGGHVRQVAGPGVQFLEEPGVGV
jgi:hypothetical protein